MSKNLSNLKGASKTISPEKMKSIIGGDFIVYIYGNDGSLERSFPVDTDGSGDGMPYSEFLNGGGDNHWNGVEAEASGNGAYASTGGSVPAGSPGPWWDNHDGTFSNTNPRQLGEVSVRPIPASEWSKFAFGAGSSVNVNIPGFQFEAGGSIVYFPYTNSLAGYLGGSAGLSPSIGAGASVDAKPYIFYSMDKQPLTFADLKGKGEQVSVTFLDASGTVVWGNNSSDAPETPDTLNYVGIGIGPGAGASGSYSISWYDGYHIIFVPLPGGTLLPIPIADRPDVYFPQE